MKVHVKDPSVGESDMVFVNHIGPLPNNTTTTVPDEELESFRVNTGRDELPEDLYVGEQPPPPKAEEPKAEVPKAEEPKPAAAAPVKKAADK